MAGISAVNIDVGSVLSGIGELAKDIRAAITGESIIDPNKRAEIEMKLLEIQNAGLQAQTAINMKEAENPNLFVSGWRPAAGWTCVLGFAYTFLAFPLLVWASSNFQWQSPPTIDADILYNLLLAMLGLGVLRTAERLTGSERSK
jgi:hypothetical protein